MSLKAFSSALFLIWLLLFQKKHRLQQNINSFSFLPPGCHVSGHWVGGYTRGSSIGSTGPLVGSYFVGPEIAMEITGIGRPGPMQMVFRKEKFTEELKSFGLSDRVVACTLAKVSCFRIWNTKHVVLKWDFLKKHSSLILEESHVRFGDSRETYQFDCYICSEKHTCWT